MDLDMTQFGAIQNQKQAQRKPEHYCEVNT